MGKYQRLVASNYRRYSEESLQSAVRDRKAGMSLRAVAKKYGIPKDTIDRRVKNLHTLKPGGQTILTSNEEQRIVNNLHLASQWGFPFTSLDVRYIIKAYLDSSGRVIQKFKNNLPGREFMRNFLQRHRQILTQRWCENIKRVRAGVNRSTINKYFDELEKSLEGIQPDAIINYDETNMTDDPGKQKVIVRRGCKHAHRVLDSSKTSQSLMFAGTASGLLLPPYIVYKAEHLYTTWTENGPAGARYNRSKTSWFNEAIFEDWFNTVVLRYFAKFDKNEPKALIGDNLASHVSQTVIELCKDNNIRFILLPPNSTHLCQPLDVAYFRPLKRAWREVLLEWKLKNRGVVPKDIFPRLLKKCLDGMNVNDRTSKNLIAGFSATGIYPIDRTKILNKFPNEPEEPQDNDFVIIDNAFEIFLRNLHTKESTTTSNRRKRLQVEPGRSIEQAEIPSTTTQPDGEPVNDSSLLQSEDEELPNLSAILKKNKIVPAEKASNDSEGSFSCQDSSDTPENFDEDVDFVNPSNILVDDFVLAEFDYNAPHQKSKSKRFIGKIKEIDNNFRTFQCTFLRKATTGKNVYVFPNVEDISEITAEQIISKLFPISSRRGRYTFSVET